MKVTTYTQEGKKSRAVEVPAGVFDAKWNPSLVHQALVVELGNRRRPLAHTKDRSEVSGGGRKPWRQKHTGRARHGSSRSPLWAGGGVTFGPRNEKNYSKKMNRAARRAALCSVLSRKFADGEIKIVDQLAIAGQKTKRMAEITRKLFPDPGSLLCIPARGNGAAFRAGRNLPKVAVVDHRNFNVTAALSARFILFEAPAIEAFATDRGITKETRVSAQPYP